MAREHLIRCPICADLMTVSSRTREIDCPGRHHATTDPEQWRAAAMRIMLHDLKAYLRPADDVDDHGHRWISIERTRYESLEECVSCAAWRVAAP